MTAAMRMVRPEYQRAIDQLDPDAAWVGKYLPVSLPLGWRLEQAAPDGASYRHRGGLVVIVSGAREADGYNWLHVSLSRARQLPSYQDQSLVKLLFVGAEREAYSVWPRASRHINIHPYALHLWHCADVAPLPDFARGGKSI